MESQIKEESSVQDIFRASIALVNLGKTLESAKISKVLSAALKKDESLFNIGLALQLAAKLTRPEDRNAFVEKIGDVIVQADEVDGKFLQVKLSISNHFFNFLYFSLKVDWGSQQILFLVFTSWQLLVTNQQD